MRCDMCKKDLENEPQHDVALVVQLEDHSLEVQEGTVCNTCLYENFAYCTECQMWYEKQNVDVEQHVCYYCKK